MRDYAPCNLCEHRCAADRSRRPAGRCHAGPQPRVFCEALECGEEPEFSPAYAISLSGCNLRCAFCITGRDSWDAARGEDAGAEEVAARALAAVAAGARSIVVLGGEPTIFLPWIEDLARRLAPAAAPLALKTNLFCTPEALDRALGVFDVVIADFKFGSDACAGRLGGYGGYVDVVRRNLLAARERRRTIVRHLVMPGHLECCARPVVRWVRAAGGLELSLRDHFVPAWRAAGAGLGRTTSAEESATAEELLREAVCP
jgi:putative pyruvate formate lyase activating enzyme